MVLYSIGHSTRPFEDFATLLYEHDVRTLADVRTVPASKRVPQYGRKALEEGLAGLPRPIRYVHLPGLGGLRKPRKDSRNTAWRVGGFRAYADYMETPEFEAALAGLLALAESGPVAFMCAEAVPWRCHRNVLSDALVARGHEVRHIMGSGKWQAHRLPEFARLEGGKLSYPG